MIKDFIAPHEISIADIEILKLQTAKDDLLLNLRHVKAKKDGKDLTLSINLDDKFNAKYANNAKQLEVLILRGCYGVI